MSSESEKKEGSGIWPVVGGLSPVLIVGAIFGGVWIWPHVHGATPAQLMAESFPTSPKQIARDLPSTESDSTSARVKFKIGTAGEYERADLTWSSSNADGPSSMRLRVEHGEHEGADAMTGISRHFHLQDGRHRWGPVTIRCDADGELRYEIDPQVDGKPNPRFARQVEAAKEVVLNAAFNVPMKVSDRDIADLLGSGYPLADVGKLDLSMPLETAMTAVPTRFPAAVRTGSSGFYIPLDHPIVYRVEMKWSNRQGGRFDTFRLSTTSAYGPSHAALEACLEKKAGPPRVTVTDYAAGRKSYRFPFGANAFTLELDESSMSIEAVVLPVDPAAFAALFQALDGCRDIAEGGMRTK